MELILELVLQVVVESLVELGFHSLGETMRRPRNPWLAALGFVLMGFLIGGLSLLVFPENFVPEEWRLLNLAVTPILAGFLMSLIGAWRTRRGDNRMRIDRFGYGFLFAFAFGLIRFLLGG